MAYTLDIVLDGRRRIATADQLDLGDLSTDSELRAALAAWLGVEAAELGQHSILRLPTGRILLRIPLKVRLAQLAQRAIEQESRYREALRRFGAGVFGHPRLRRGLVSAIGSLQSLAAGLEAVVTRCLAGPLGGTRRALGSAVWAVDGALVRLAGQVVRATLGVCRLLAGPVEAAFAACAEVRDALRDVSTDALALLGRGVLALARGGRVMLAPLARLALAGLDAVEHACERLVDLVWPLLRLLGCGALTLVRVWQSLCRAAVATAQVLVDLAMVRPVLLVGYLGLTVARSSARVAQLVTRGLAELGDLAVARLVAVTVRPFVGVVRFAAAQVRRARRFLRPWACLAWGWLVGTVDRLVTGRTAEQRERDHRVRVLDSLLTTPHGNLRRAWPLHERLAREDPLFYVHLAAWYADKGSVRDHQEMFIIVLVLSALPAHREVGLALLRRLPPYEVARVVDFIKRTARRTPPRSLRTEVERYLREREAQPGHFDGAVLAAREPLKTLYATLRIRPSERAQAILFDNAPPADSRLSALKELARLRGKPREQADLLRRTVLPYKVAASVLGPLTEETAEALVARMSPQEVINHVGSLRRQGPAVAALVERKLIDARTHARVSAYKAEVATASAPEWGEHLQRVTREQILRRGRLTVSTALLVDASASMTESLEVGKRIASMLAMVAQSPLVVLGFNQRAWEIADFSSVRAEGATSPGAAVAWLLRHDRMVEQLVLVTDQRENQRPRLAAALRLYRRRNPHLRVVFITLPGGTDELYRQTVRLGLDTRDHRFGGDYYSLPDLLPMLSAPTRLGLLTEVLETPLPRR